MPTAHLHLGVHKTATTFMQEQILHHVQNKGSNFDYVELKNLRRNVTYKIRKPYYSARTRLGKIYDLNNDLLISDESLPGDIEDIYQKGALYPFTSLAISKLHKALPDHKLKVFLTLREPLSYFASVYCEYLRHFQYIPFEEYVKEIDIHDFDWSEIFAPIIEAYPHLEFHINDFSNFKNNQLEVINSLSFGEVESLTDHVGQSRQTITQQAIDFISLIEKDSHLILKQLEIANYMHGERFNPFTEAQLDISRQRFQNNLALLDKYENVTLV